MSKLPVEFTLEPYHMAFKSEQEGRPIYEDREFIRIVIPGNRGSEIYREVTAKDREEYAEEYKRFKSGIEGDGQISGTPLSAWPAMTPAMIREFSAMNIKTVENLSMLSDTSMQNFMGARDWVLKAKAYLEQAKDSAAVQKYAAENAELRRDMEILKAQMAEIASAPKGRKALATAE